MKLRRIYLIAQKSVLKRLNVIFALLKGVTTFLHASEQPNPQTQSNIHQRPKPPTQSNIHPFIHATSSKIYFIIGRDDFFRHLASQDGGSTETWGIDVSRLYNMFNQDLLLVIMS